jgi:hypothetical protein
MMCGGDLLKATNKIYPLPKLLEATFCTLCLNIRNILLGPQMCSLTIVSKHIGVLI